MKIIRKLLLFAIACIWPDAVFTQDTNPFSTSAFYRVPLPGKPYVSPKLGNGLPYLPEKWCKGDVMLTSGDTVSVEYLRFDCLKNELVWTKDGSLLISIDQNFIKGFVLKPYDNQGREFMKARVKLPVINDTIVGFPEILAKGKFSIYAMRNIKVKSELVSGKGGRHYYLPEYIAEPVFFIRYEDGPLKQISIRKRSLAGAYPEYSEQMRHILHSHRFGAIQNESQLVESINLINKEWH